MPASEDAASSEPSRAITRKRYCPGGRLSYDAARRPVAAIQCPSKPSSLYRKTTRSGARRLHAVNSISTRWRPGPIVDLAGGRNTLAIHQDRLHANRRVVAGPRRSGLEMDRALDAGKPQFAIRRHASRGLHAAIDLGGLQAVAGSVGEHRDGVDLAVGGGVQVRDGCRGNPQRTAHPEPAAGHRRSPGKSSCSTGLRGS